MALLAGACAGSSGSGSAAPASTDDPDPADAVVASTTAPTPPTTVPEVVTTSTSTPPSDPCVDGGAAGGAGGVVVSGGLEYPYSVFVPPGLDGQPVPVVLEFHGLGSDGPGQAGLSGYAALALREGFVVVSPTGPPAAGDTANSWELVQFDDAARDDVAMVRTLVDQVAQDVCVDRSRVYATGLSNGGYFSARLACEAADLVAAVVAVAAISHPDGCAPSRPVPVMAIHGTADAIVPFDGSGESVLLTDDMGPAVRAAFSVFFEQVMPDELAEFATGARCASVVDEAVGPDTSLRRYTDCDGGVEMRFYTVRDGGHTWPGSPLAALLAPTLGYATTDIDATADGWAFMSGYAIPR